MLPGDHHLLRHCLPGCALWRARSNNKLTITEGPIEANPGFLWKNEDIHCQSLTRWTYYLRLTRKIIGELTKSRLLGLHPEGPLILTDLEIEMQRHRGKIIIEPWNPANLNPNSYNLTLASTLLYYPPDTTLDLRTYTDPLGPIEIPLEGYVLQPSFLYLGKTVEYTETYDHIPVIDGRSSLGRVGLSLVGSAGDVGYKGNWTLSFYVALPLRIYSGIQICQIRYERADGQVRRVYSGKYQNSRNVIPSLVHEEIS